MAAINLGRPTGPRLRDLSLGQERQLDSWLTLALMSPPDRREDIPVDYTRALAALAKRRGIPFCFAGHESQVAGEAVLGRNIPGCVGGSKRRVGHRVVTVPGRKVEPWNMREWRE